MPTIMISGGAGYLGTELTKSLLKDYKVIVYDRFNFPWIILERLAANILDHSFIDTLSFKIGYSKQMRGLNYAIKLLQIGDKAKIIIPSYLGFGISGYGKLVPPYSTLFLNVKLLNIKK